MKVNLSIGDFSPLLREQEYLFKRLQHTGIDGIELWIGLKSRWTPDQYLNLSRKYSLPIVSLHQPLWSMAGLYFDEGFFKLAQRLGVQYITCHPLPHTPLPANRMQRYFEHLAVLQHRTHIPVLIENMPLQYRSRLLRRFSALEPDTSSIPELCSAIRPHGLGLTLDTDHLQLAKPYNESWFDIALPLIKNIHLSNFTNNRHHQPLDRGRLDVRGLCQHLKRKNYNGLITLEISTPSAVTWLAYDQGAVERSVRQIRF